MLAVEVRTVTVTLSSRFVSSLEEEAAPVVEPPVLRGLAEDSARRLWSQGRREPVEPGAEVFGQGAPAREVVVVRGGWLGEFYLDAAGTEMLVSVGATGSVFGYTAVRLGLRHATSVRGLRGGGVVYRFDRARFTTLVRTDPELAAALDRADTTHLLRAGTGRVAFHMQPAPVRVARVIVQLAEYVPGHHRWEVPVPLSSDQLAALAVTGRRTTEKTLGELSRDGVVVREGRKFPNTVIKAPQELRTVALLPPAR